MKYLHLLIDHFYSRKFFDVIINHFDPQEHHFMVFKTQNNKSYFDGLKHQNLEISVLPNNIFRRILKKEKHAKLLMNDADCIFIHFLSDDITRLLRRFKKRGIVLWVIWGADLYSNIPMELYDPKTKELMIKLNELNELKNLIRLKELKNLKNLIIRLIFFRYLRKIVFKYLRKSVIKNIDYVITATKGDVKYLKMYYNTNAKWYTGFHYPNPIDFEKIQQEKKKIDKKYNFKNKFSKLILLGNSGNPSNNHVDILYYLSEINDKDFGIICPVSYTSFSKYIQELIIIGKSLFGDRFIPLIEFLDAKIYFHILNQVDVVIMNHNRQQGVGNINILLYLKKIIYIKRKNSLFDHLIEKKVKIYSMDEFYNKLKLGESIFKVNDDLEKNKQYAIENLTLVRIIQNLKELFDSFILM